MRLRFLAPALLMLSAVSSSAQNPAAAAPTPPMGWNSWDAYGLTITEAQFRANVQVLHDKLLPFGWRYAVIDEGWFFFNPEARSHPDTLKYSLDDYGRYTPVPERFPSGYNVPTVSKGAPPSTARFKLTAYTINSSFKPIADFVHSQGLLFGIHIVRGIPRATVERNLPIADSSFHAQDAADTTDACGWDPTNWGVKDNAAGQAWYDSLIRQYAGWGVDLLKVDCIADHPYKITEIRQIRRAIDKVHAETGHNMVLSLSPGPTNPAHAAEVASLANMWRISDDFWDTWAPAKPGQTFPQPLKGQFDRLAAWAQFDLKPGQWPDPDMLPIGELRPSPGWGEPRHTRFTPDEQKTLMTLWSITQSPLILGANLTMLDNATLQLLTNRDVLALDQHAIERGKPVDAFRTGDLRVWRAEVKPEMHGQSGLRVALFNLSDAPMQIDRTRRELGLERENYRLLDVWTRKFLTAPADPQGHVRLTIPPHGCALLELIPPPLL